MPELEDHEYLDPWPSYSPETSTYSQDRNFGLYSLRDGLHSLGYEVQKGSSSKVGSA